MINMKRSNTLGSAILLIVLPFLILTSCNGKKESRPSAADSAAMAAKLVETTIVKTDTLTEVLSFTATVRAEVTNNITPQMGNRIVRLTAEVGDRVGRGQVLAELDRSQLTQAKVQLENTRTNFQRMDELYKIGGIAKQQWDALKTQLDVAETTYNNLLENTVLRSPISGVITARNYDSGDMASPTKPIYVVEQITPVKLRIDVSEQYFSRLKKGMPATITVDALQGQTFEGKISLVYPAVDASTHTIGVEIQIANRDQQLRPGMYARVNLDFGHKSAVMVEDLAVVKQVGSGEFFVFVVENGKAVRRMVKVGARQNDSYEIIEGLNVGETVVTAGMNNLMDGQSVRIKEQSKL